MGALSIPLCLPRVGNPELEGRKYLNFLLSLMERRERAVEVEAQPFEVTVDLATLCQLSCPYCSTGAGTMERTRGLMTEAVHRRFLEELSDSLFLIWYFSTGEPLLNKALPSIVSLTRGKDVYSVISTNLSLPLSERRIDEILTCGLGCISISADGASEETYRQYRVGGKFDLVMENMRRLVERKRELGLELPHIEWRFLVFKHNQHEIAAARRRAAEIGVDLLEFFPGYAPEDAGEGDVRACDPVDLEPAISGPAVDRAAAGPHPTLLREIGGPHWYAPRPPEEHPRFRKKCDWLYFGTTVFPNGSVSPCCLSNEERDDFGSLGEGGRFSEVWNNAAYREARSLWNEGGWDRTELVCARCPDRTAQDYQFRTTIQALLRNAPDWVLKVLSADPERFFFDVDFWLSPRELEPLRKRSLRLPRRFPELGPELEGHAKQATPRARERIAWIREAVGAAH